MIIIDENIIMESKEIADLADEVIEEHKDLWWIVRSGVRIAFLRSSKLKKSKGRLVCGECILVKENYKWCCPYDFMIVLYGPNTAGMTGEQLKILLWHELLHVGMSMNIDGEPVYRIVSHDVEDFRVILNKHGFDWAGTKVDA